MQEPRSPQTEELQEVIQFLNSKLREKSDWSIQTEYPLVFSLSNSNNIKFIRDTDTGEILSHAVFKVHILKTPVGIFKVAAIGSVVTDSNHRNKGLSHKVIETCLESARKHGCDFAILWSDLFDFYRKLGFELSGSEVSIVINKELPVENKNLRILEGTQFAPEALLNLYTQHTVGGVRTPKDIEHYLKIPNSRVYTAWSQTHQLMAYAVEGKGEDLQGYIHEWGGNVTDVTQLINYIHKTQNKELTLITSSTSQNLTRRLKELGCPQYNGFLGMIKLLIPENLAQKINRHALSLGLKDFKMNYSNGIFSWSINDRVYSSDSEQEMVKLIFGPRKASELFKFDTETQQALEQIFPLPLWMWGWDSI